MAGRSRSRRYACCVVGGRLVEQARLEELAHQLAGTDRLLNRRQQVQQGLRLRAPAYSVSARQGRCWTRPISEPAGIGGHEGEGPFGVLLVLGQMERDAAHGAPDRVDGLRKPSSPLVCSAAARAAASTPATGRWRAASRSSSPRGGARSIQSSQAASSGGVTAGKRSPRRAATGRAPSGSSGRRRVRRPARRSACRHTPPDRGSPRPSRRQRPCGCGPRRHRSAGGRHHPPR